MPLSSPEDIISHRENQIRAMEDRCSFAGTELDQKAGITSNYSLALAAILADTDDDSTVANAYVVWGDEYKTSEIPNRAETETQQYHNSVEPCRCMRNRARSTPPAYSK